MAAAGPTASTPPKGTPGSGAPLEARPPPILARVDALLHAGQDAEAIRVAYNTVEGDIRRAFGLKLPAQWTHRELLEKYLRRDMGYLTTLLPRLYAIFEPVRYGPPGPASSAGLMETLRAIYNEPALRRLSWTIGADSTLTSRAVVRGSSAPAPTPAGPGKV